MANQQRKYLIPMGVSKETIRDFGINPKEVSYQKIGNEVKLVHLVETTKEVYYAYMRPLWNEDKRRQRLEERQETTGEIYVSLDKLKDEYDLDIADDSASNTDETLMKKELLAKLKEVLATLEEKDREIVELFMEGKTETSIGKTVGLSQKAVNKRKHRIFNELEELLKDFR